MKMIIPLQESGLLIKGVGETSKNEPKQKSRLLGTLSAILLGNWLADKNVIETGERRITAGQDL